jgi:hypothetical protein
MTWSSDSTSVLLYAILATLFVLSWVYVSGVRREPRGDQAGLQR